MMGYYQIIRPIPVRAFLCRKIHTSPVSSTIKWRLSKGLPIHKDSAGPLTDLPDYTYLDGRPTPLGGNQKTRMMLQQSYAQKIVTLCSEIDFAIQRQKDIQAQNEEKRNTILSGRLKAKGDNLVKS